MAAITKALIGQDMSSDLQSECSAHLDTLTALGTAKSQYYAEKINTTLLGASQGIDRTFPITTIQSFIYQVKAYTSDNAKNIGSVVNDSIKGFVSGDTTSAVGTIVSGFVNILFGSTVGSESEVIRYCAVLEGVSMIRLDFAGWSRSVTSTALKSKCDQVSAFVLYRSIVDMGKVSLNDFIAVYQNTVKATDPSMAPAAVIKACQDLYYIFNPAKAPHDAPAPHLRLQDAGGKPFEPSKGYASLEVFKKGLNTL